ncbi:MAG TPA: response regulator [Myxococcaceae bacterium]|nr:response regulator [Myxococcaceae bacterium]
MNRDDLVSPVILISDDDPRVVRALSQQVNRAGAWAVPDLSSEVRQIAKVVHPSLVVLDLNQARWGVDLLLELKADPETREVPVVVLTANGTPELREECLRAGAEAFVEKPFDVSFVVDIARKAALAKRERDRQRVERKTVEQQAN